MATVIAAAVVVLGCGEAATDRALETATQQQSERPSSEAATGASNRPALEPGPDVESGVVPDQLLIRGDADAYVTSRLAEVGGEVVEDTRAGLRVAFDVRDLDELLRIRDTLRAQGVPAQTIEASGLPDDPDGPV